VGQLGLQHLPTEPAALPDRVVSVLDRQLRQGRRAALQAGIVEGAQLPRQHPQRPAVADHVVHGQQEELLRLAQAHQGRAQQRSTLGITEVERTQSLLARQPAGLLQAPGGRQTREIDLRHRDRSGRIDHLDRLPLDRDASGPQRLVAARHLPQSRGESRAVEPARQMQRGRHVVDRARRLQPMEEPEPLLGEGERQGCRTRHGNERRGIAPGLAPGFARDRPRQSRHGRRLEDAVERQLGAERLADPCDQPHGGQRVAAVLEEALLHTEPVDSQHLGEEAGQQLLERRPRRLRRLEGAAGQGHGDPAGERPAVELAVRQAVERPAEGDGRHHVGRQVGGQGGAQLGRRAGSGVRRRRHHAGEQRALPRAVLAHHDRGLAHLRLGRQGDLDLARLDAEAADLHLVVEPAQVFDLPPGEVAAEVAGPVQAGSRGTKRIGDEPLRRQVRTPAIAARHLHAADRQLPHRPGRHRLQPPAHDVDLRVADRPADRHRARVFPWPRALRRPAAPGRHLDRGLGRTIQVIERHRQRSEAALLHLPGQGLAADQHPAQRAAARRQSVLRQVLRQEEGEHRGHEMDRRDPLPLDQPGQVGAVAVPVRPGHHQPRSEDQGSEEFRDRDVEAERSLLQEPVARVQAAGLLHPQQPVDDAAVAVDHPLRPAGRARGVDDVGGVVGRRPREPLRRTGRQAGRQFGPIVEKTVEPGETQTGDGVERQRPGQGTAGEDDGRRRILQDHRQALPGKVRLQRQVGAAGAEHAEQAGDQLDRALRRHSHHHLGPHSEPHQMVRQGLCPGRQLAVGQPLLVGHHRHRLRRPLGLRREQIVEGRLRAGLRRVVPGMEELVALRRGEERQRRERELGALHDRPEQQGEAVQQAHRGRGVEQVGVELQREAQPALALHRMEHQLERSRRPGQGERLQPEVLRPHLDPLLAEGEGGEPFDAARLLLHHERNLKQRRPAGLPHGLEVLGEERQRIVSVLEGGEHRRLGALQKLRERGVSGQVSTQNHRVDEVAHCAGELRPGPAGAWRADRQVLLAGVAAQEHLERGGQRHEKRGVLLSAARAQGRRELARQPKPAAVAPIGLHRRTRPVEGELESGEPCQALLPVSQQGLAPSVTQGLPFHPDMLFVVHPGRRELRRPGAGRFAVQQRQLTNQDGERPEVGDDVVNGKEDHRPAGAAHQQCGAKERPALQVEGAPSFFGQTSPQRLLAPTAGIHAHQGEALASRDPPAGCAVDRRKRRP
jgi:hypothetical protein